MSKAHVLQTDMFMLAKQDNSAATCTNETAVTVVEMATARTAEGTDSVMETVIPKDLPASHNDKDMATDGGVAKDKGKAKQVNVMMRRKPQREGRSVIIYPEDGLLFLNSGSPNVMSYWFTMVKSIHLHSLPSKKRGVVTIDEFKG
ncbi:hypothetical protein EDD15DRAFT_2204308 [Pisolithus albus]|nr:hypothetical protein EDD15DRAFT_2204308 [Pisolithus albus]